MEARYTTERNIGMLIALMKSHNVRKVVASPGSTNISFVASIQNDTFFEIYSAPDERSAAYMACGLAAEAKEPVALTCTGATASRNYVPGLTEAYYRKLPILAITSTQHTGQVGQYVPQVIDRSAMMNDIVNMSVQIPIIHDEMDAWSVNVALNNALLELRHRGGGPVHINLTTSYPFYPMEFTCTELPKTRSIFRVEHGDELPDLIDKKVAIFVGNHEKMNGRLIDAIDRFCGVYNAVVLCDHTSNYTGEFATSASLVTSQDLYRADCRNIDVLIHIGQVSGAYLPLEPHQVWRVNPDGVVRDTYRKLKYVFELEELDFFDLYASKKAGVSVQTSFCQQWSAEHEQLSDKIPELPFSNIWIAQQTITKLPGDSYLYLGILNSLRAWNFFELRKDITGFSNTGGFGIDGGLSSLLGGALAHPDKLHYEILGDLGFFYDMNVLGNRHISSNMRILLVNNGKGTEFRNYTHFASKFNDDADKFIAAGGHYGDKSPVLVKHYAEDLGFVYLSASTKEEYLEALEFFCSPEIGDRPIIFEAFTTNEDENEALRLMRNLGTTAKDLTKSKLKESIKGVVGQKGIDSIKKIVKR